MPTGRRVSLLPSDRRRKVSVNGGGETVMVKVVLSHCSATEVDGLQHAAGGQYAQHRVHVRVLLVDSSVQRCRQFLVAIRFQIEALKHIKY